MKMGLFSFKKKKEDDPLGLSNTNLGLSPETQQAQQYGYQNPYPPQDMNPGFSQGAQQPAAFQQQQAYQYGNQNQQYGGQQQYSNTDSQLYMIQKGMEVLSAKLDSIQMGLQNLNQRIANIEMRMKERSW
jgi:peptidoglycan hydrolase CwlO-like protein